MKNRNTVLKALAACTLLTSGCSAIISSTTAGLADSLSEAVLNQNDPETVRQGAPAYLVLIDGLIADNPKNPHLLLGGAQLYSSYAGAFVSDHDRERRLSLKGRDYGWEGMCATRRSACGIWTRPYDEFEAVITGLGKKDVPALFTTAMAWVTWIEANRDDMAAVADKARVDAMIRQVVTLDPSYGGGRPEMLLGVLATLLPEALGGQPEEGKRHFERAIELSGNRDLMAKVMMASQYARLVFDRELHDRLCREVIAADPEAPGLTLSNTLAQERARALLADSEDYFGD